MGCHSYRRLLKSRDKVPERAGREEKRRRSLLASPPPQRRSVLQLLVKPGGKSRSEPEVTNGRLGCVDQKN